MNAEVQNFCVSFDRYMDIEKSVVDVLCSTVNLGFMHTSFGFL